MEGAIAVAKQQAQFTAAGGHEVELAVGVEVTDCERKREITGRGGQGRPERAVRVAKEYAHAAAENVDDCEVGLAVAVEVGCQHAMRICAGGVARHGVEAEQAAVFQGFEVEPMHHGSKRASSPVMALAPARCAGGAEVLQPTVE